MIRPWKNLAAAASLAACLSGCRRAPEPAQTDGEQAGTALATMPDVPGAADEKPAAADVLVKDDTVLKRFHKPTYVQDVKVPAGTLRGLCYVRTARRRRKPLPRSHPVDIAKGPMAIKDPKEGEIEFFSKVRPRRPVYLGHHERTRRIGVVGAALFIPGIKKGLRKPMHWRNVFNTFNGRLSSFEGGPYDSSTLKFTPLKDRLIFRLYDPFPATFVLTDLSTGEVVCQQPMGGYGIQRRHPVGSGAEAGYLYADIGHNASHNAPYTQSPRLKKLHNVYKLTSKRQPWIEGYAITVDNPYVVVTSRHGGGGFQIAGIPVGKWTLHVWHPRLQPLARTHEFEIREDDITEIPIPFKPPPGWEE